MKQSSQKKILRAHLDLPEGCRSPPASTEEIQSFESKFGKIPDSYRWYLLTCGGGTVGSEWIDNIKELERSHQRFKKESSIAGGWTMAGVFIIGWDGAGNPFGICIDDGSILVEDHNFGGIHKMAESFESFLSKGLLG